MKISCIIPTCDRNDFLLEAIYSVLQQSLKADEVIIVNNGKDKLKLLSPVAERVKIFNIVPYAGAAQARNFGASVAQGDYLAFLDDDDLWNKKYLENVKQAISRGAVCIVSKRDKLMDGKVTPYKNPHKRLTIKNLLTFNPGIGGSNLVIKKALFFKVGGFDPKLPPSEDKGLIIELLKNKIDVITLPDNQTIQRMHQGNRLSDSSKMIEGIFQLTRKYRHLLSQRDYLINLARIAKYQYKTGSKLAGLKFIFIKLIIYLL